MASRVFAVLIGIDQYKSGDIWDLHSSASDARGIKHWLVNDLKVPRSQVITLLDEQASLDSIEASLRHHLLNNDKIQTGDAILIYFAGHGSSVRTPSDWVDDETAANARVEVLCPYDHETKTADGRVAGISARAMHTFLRDLSSRKGNNITFIIDSSFTPPHSRERAHTRWTTSNKALPEDLYSGPLAAERSRKIHESFYDCNSSHTLIAASTASGTAVEGKEGGRFTSLFLETVRSMPLHSTSFPSLMDHISRKMGDAQQPMFADHKGSRFLLNAIPFIEDERFVPVRPHDDNTLRLDVGTLDGIVKGGQLSLHTHNYSGSRNLPIANAIVCDVQPTWCTVAVRSKSRYTLLPNPCWARIDQHRALASVVKASCTSVLQKMGIHQKRSNSLPASVPPVPTRSSSFDKMEISETELAVPML
ncbi:hypothetical protein K435DRAFT_648091 [Dendrothele bispora CBS 962.96]|uniref:Peptidase C14 caspase domain-containing protein n=1 Tax=Dendrothele bispora (strain CBS 962.96) TaxID=1314807 RepID=A0A4S8MPQ9_DENBC|nr:hypothetical protein K435DRAFT_648091 [Dendrothele bispora CBS 962.96]